MSALYSSNSDTILGINSLFHFSSDGYNARTERTAPQRRLFSDSEIEKPEGIAEKIL